MPSAGGTFRHRLERPAKALEGDFGTALMASLISTTFIRSQTFSVQVLIGLTLLGTFGCSKEPTHTLQGIASWYGYPHHGRLTASGRRFNMYELTAAHRTLPLGTRLRVTNLSNGRSVTVTITDRGPFVKDRVIDLSYAAARRIDMIGPGTALIQLAILP
jgi:rare lipoprotein A (peptidoglycan hydrolase)